MSYITTRDIAVLLAALVALSVLPMGGMAAPSTDTAGTNQSEVTDNYTVTKFNASGTVGWLNASYDSDHIKLEIIDPETGEVVNTIENGSDRWTEYNTSTNEYAINLTESDFATMPMDADENKSVELRLYGNISKDDSPTTNVTVFLENTNERAVVHAGSAATDDGGIAEVDEVEQGSLWWAETVNTTTLEADNVGVNGSTTDVYVIYADDTVEEPYETAAANKTSWVVFTKDYSDGDLIGDHIGMVDGQAYGVYYEEAPDEADNPEDHTYYTWTSVEGESAHKINLGDEYDDETAVDIETVGNEEPDRFTDVQELDTGGIFSMSLTTAPGVYGPTGA